MRLTHLGHACLLLETQSTRLLVDPGTYSTGFEDLTGLSAILVTHQHPDHLDTARLPAVRAANPDARLLIETETVAAHELDGDGVTSVSAGAATTVGAVEVRAVGGRHAHNHDQVPSVGNVGYLFSADGTTVFHPGDSYDATPDGVDVLGLPINAPWCRMRETLAFLHAISPRVVIPIHDGLLNQDGLAGYLLHVRRFGPDGTDVVDLRPGSTYVA